MTYALKYLRIHVSWGRRPNYQNDLLADREVYFLILWSAANINFFYIHKSVIGLVVDICVEGLYGRRFNELLISVWQRLVAAFGLGCDRNCHPCLNAVRRINIHVCSIS